MCEESKTGRGIGDGAIGDGRPDAYNACSSVELQEKAHQVNHCSKDGTKWPSRAQAAVVRRQARGEVNDAIRGGISLASGAQSAIPSAE